MQDNCSVQQSVTEAPAAGKKMRVAVIGGSNSVMSKGYTHYLREHILDRTGIVFEYGRYALGGAVTSLFGLVQNIRHDIAKNHDVVFLEYCVNDRGFVRANRGSALKFIGRSVEGLVRRIRQDNPHCIIVLLVFGTNRKWYYDALCMVSSVYQSIASRYDIACINITELLLKRQYSLEDIMALYGSESFTHYSRPDGVKKVAKLIADEIIRKRILEKAAHFKFPVRLFAHHLADLKYFDAFEMSSLSGDCELQVFSNSVYKETMLRMKAGASCSMFLSGQIFALYILSARESGYVELRLGDQSISMSTFLEDVTVFKQDLLTMAYLPLEKPLQSETPQKFVIRVHREAPETVALGWHQRPPQAQPSEWNVALVGIVYKGKITV